MNPRTPTPAVTPLALAALVLLGVARAATAADPAPANLRVGNLPVNKVLFLGNSITLHAPAPKIGWDGNWGMAASAADKDYVHLVTDRLTKAAGGKPQVRVTNVVAFERGYDAFDLAAGLKDELAFDADVVVIAIGENVAALKDDQAKAKYAAAFARLLAELKKENRHPAIFVRSTFWADKAKDAAMRAETAAAGATFVDISALEKDPANAAKSERKIDHPGVGAHPGDKGMTAIAEAIASAIEKTAAAAPAAKP